MEKGKNKTSKILSATFILVGIAGLIIVLALDKYYWQIGILTEGWPIFSQEYIIRSLVVIISLSALIYNAPWPKQKIILAEKNGWTFERWSVITILIVSLVFLVIFLVTPSAFSAGSQEDSIIEWGSFIFLILSCILFILSFVKGQNNRQVKPLTMLIFLLFAFTFFLIGMEEVSWLQRVIGIETPEILKNNMQSEMNLHNFATSKVEDAYYFSAFLVLVLLPYIRIIFPNLLKYDSTEVFVPRPFIALAGAFACAYNFDMWNIIFTQTTFWGTVVILISFSIFTARKNDKIIIGSVLLVILLTQACFLANGNNFQRIWEVTEYKELLIPMAYFIYAIDVFRITVKPVLKVGTKDSPHTA
ncbi:MAG TPA: hypothetical protein VFC65_21045 [Prolixibacteraceae bacterium]|nr:hypothetical protein [Prolixibacteraceae bacterium]